MLDNRARLGACVRAAPMLLALLVSACSPDEPLPSYHFQPYPDVEVTLTVTGIDHGSSGDLGDTTTLHIRYVVDTKSNRLAFFNVESMRATVSGLRSIGAYYDTVASVAPHSCQLPAGRSGLAVYLVLPGHIDAAAFRDATFPDLGLSRQPPPSTSKSCTLDVVHTVTVPVGTILNHGIDRHGPL